MTPHCHLEIAQKAWSVTQIFRLVFGETVEQVTK
jgi:hypothetical protein